MEKRAGYRKEQIRESQTKRELNNKLKRIDRLTKAGEPVPTVLFEKVAELEQRLIK